MERRVVSSATTVYATYGGAAVSCTIYSQSTGLSGDCSSGISFPASVNQVEVYVNAELKDSTGNTEYDGLGYVGVDNRPPEIVHLYHELGPNGYGWNNSDVIVTADCYDAYVGVDTCTLASPTLGSTSMPGGRAWQRVSTEGIHQFTASAVDRLGQVSSPSPLSDTVALDKTPPGLIIGQPTPSPNKNGWYNTFVTAPCTATDNLSGVASFFTEGQGLVRVPGQGSPTQGPLQIGCTLQTGSEAEVKDHLFEGTVTDYADNSAPFTWGPFNIDMTPPQVEVVLEGQQVGGGYIAPVTISANCTDALSGMDFSGLELGGNPTPSPATLTQPGTYTVVATCVDRAGNEASSNPVIVNVISPSSLRVPQDVPSVQEAISRVADGGTVDIAPGAYNERVQISNKSVALRGAGRDQTILDGAGLGPANGITISGGAQVIIEGLTIRNFSDNGVGISDSARATIQSCLITGNGDNGIEIKGSTEVTVQDCVIANNSGNGIWMGELAQVHILNNTIRENRDHGIEAASLDNLVECRGNTVSDNAGGNFEPPELAQKCNASLSTMVLIPAGSFQMGDSFNEGFSAELPVHTVTVSAFYMDKFEVTKAFWDEVASWAQNHGYDIGPNSGSASGANHPVNGVSWYGAVKWLNARSEREGLAPCYYTDSTQRTVYRTGNVDVPIEGVKWSGCGYRLPTEAEWEKAARGGLVGQRYPWGNDIDCTKANYSPNPPPFLGLIAPCVGDTTPVGLYPANGYGLYDMAGNVSEWVWDWYYSLYYANSPGNDPRGPASGSARVIRGGGWRDAIDCRVAARYSSGPDSSDNIGFRAVRPADQ